MSSFRNRLGKEILIFDGASGTMLQKSGLPTSTRPEIWNVTNPEAIIDLHRRYIAAGADIIKTNTFGANLLNFSDNGDYSVETIVSAALNCVNQAVTQADRETYIALDIGPLGKLVGTGLDLDFEEAVDIFARTVKAGCSGCDLVLLETFGDLCEVRAALLAVKENCDLPVVVTNVYSADGRTFSGSDAVVMARVLDGMGADAVGMNCSLGPLQMEPILPLIAKNTLCPIAVNPNAGLPRTNSEGIAEYDISPDEFVASMLRMAEGGATLLGGCCGTTPEYIEKLCSATRGLTPASRNYDTAITLCSATRTCSITDERLTVIGERINPTGKRMLKEALKRGDIDYLLAEAHRQIACGADILDVNTGLPEIDERIMLTQTVERLQNVCDLPLQIDTADPSAMEAALRRYNGRALINSVNGSRESMDAVFPLAAKYGGVVVALTLDESGIPETPEGRLAVAEKILAEAEKYGLSKNDLIVDPLTLTLGADPEAANKTLGAVRLIRERLGLATSLGVSNISFGLPDRETVNRDFLLAAMAAGLNAAILNPCSEFMMSVARCKSGSGAVTDDLLLSHRSSGYVSNSDVTTLKGCICGGLSVRARELAQEYADSTSPTEIIDRDIIPALEAVGLAYEKGTLFLPGLLAAAEAAISALGVLTDIIELQGGEKRERGKVVLATVQGDIHDIGKNIVAVLLRSYGFTVIDLGRDVPPQKIIDTVRESGAEIVGLSALMTTTLPSMRRTIELLDSELPHVKTVVGGAVLSEEYATDMNADKYAPVALDTVKFAVEIYG